MKNILFPSAIFSAKCDWLADGTGSIDNDNPATCTGRHVCISMAHGRHCHVACRLVDNRGAAYSGYGAAAHRTFSRNGYSDYHREQRTLCIANYFLLLGGFLIAMGLEKWNLHRRLALSLLMRTGSHPAMVLASVMGITAFLSMWISNTASTLMMIPIALSLISGLTKTCEHDRFVLSLVLGIAYSASIGGLGTLIGTPPNMLLAAFMRQTYGYDISFLDWMLLGVPVVMVLLCLAWWVLHKWTYR